MSWSVRNFLQFKGKKASIDTVFGKVSIGVCVRVYVCTVFVFLKSHVTLLSITWRMWAATHLCVHVLFCIKAQSTYFSLNATLVETPGLCTQVYSHNEQKKQTDNSTQLVIPRSNSSGKENKQRSDFPQ